MIETAKHDIFHLVILRRSVPEKNTLAGCEETLS